MLTQENAEIVTWESKYATEIEGIDAQHKALVDLINQLYKASMTRNESMDTVFRESMSHMVEYVRFHFSAENGLMGRIGYPNYNEHKKQHETLVKKIIDAAKSYEEGHIYAPNNFVRDLRDWVLSHIAISDKSYATFALEKKKKGLLTDKDLEC